MSKIIAHKNKITPHIHFICACLILFCPAFLPAQSPESKTCWQKLAPNLEQCQRELPSRTLLHPVMTLIRANNKSFRVSVIRAAEFGLKRATAQALCKASGASVCVNANFFDENGDPLGLIISHGILQHKLHQGGKTLTGIFQVTRLNAGIVNRSDFVQGPVLEAVQAGPRLIVNGVPVTGLKDELSNGRSGVCIDTDDRIILYAGYFRFPGVTLSDVQAVLSSDPIRCVEALNFDGGGSAQLFVNPEKIDSQNNQPKLSIEGFDEVPVVLGLFADQ